MPSLLITILMLQVVIHLINNIGVTTINNLAWQFYTFLPIPASSASRTQRSLQQTLLKQRRELNTISSQDEFARWAKVRRQHDKTLAELEKVNSKLASSKATFTTTVTAVRWLSTNGLRFVLQFWCARTPVFWLPWGWLPWWVEWLLAFPKAPSGSVSVQVWFMACTTVIALVGTGAVAAYGLVKSAEGEKEVAQKFQAGVGTPLREKMKAVEPEEVKKEL